jgi:hypothetical protein
LPRWSGKVGLITRRHTHPRPRRARPAGTEGRGITALPLPAPFAAGQTSRPGGRGSGERRRSRDLCLPGKPTGEAAAAPINPLPSSSGTPCARRRPRREIWIAGGHRVDHPAIANFWPASKSANPWFRPASCCRFS